MKPEGARSSKTETITFTSSDGTPDSGGEKIIFTAEPNPAILNDKGTATSKLT
ncbi:MAG TPA: hypothetical protein P5052_03165 [Candidatus Paceibacterota bacterium]|nr:hypothetical protein [Candidatus Paceibacterota bacterium]